jgi:hypothetical protein
MEAVMQEGKLQTVFVSTPNVIIPLERQGSLARSTHQAILT